MDLVLKRKGQCETLPSSRDWALWRLRRVDSGKDSHPLLVSARFSQGPIYRLQSENAVK